jgi:hypothetical protein
MTISAKSVRFDDSCQRLPESAFIWRVSGDVVVRPPISGVTPSTDWASFALLNAARGRARWLCRASLG